MAEGVTRNMEKAVEKQKGEGHRERLRDRFMDAGLSGFHDYEVIELLLTLATPRKDCKASAKVAIEKFETLQGVFEASVKDLCEIDGIGPKNALGIKLIQAAAERYLEKRLIRKDPLSNSRALFDYLYHSMGFKDRESFKVLFLDAKNRVITVETLFVGTLTSSSVYPREVIRAALDRSAAALIFVHNHPSGDCEPSPADFAITRQLLFACQTVGVTVHEHIIVGNHQYFSFADQGHIAQMQREFRQQAEKA